MENTENINDVLSMIAQEKKKHRTSLKIKVRQYNPATDQLYVRTGLDTPESEGISLLTKQGYKCLFNSTDKQTTVKIGRKGDIVAKTNPLETTNLLIYWD